MNREIYDARLNGIPVKKLAEEDPELREQITAGVHSVEEMEYHVIINFDDIAFNQPAAKQ